MTGKLELQSHGTETLKDTGATGSEPTNFGRVLTGLK